MLPVEIIINFTRNVWEVLFPENRVAPRTLCYDPMLTIPGLTSGLCHIAHSYISLENLSPDQQIFYIDADSLKFSCCDDMGNFFNIKQIPTLECLLFVSNPNMTQAQLALEKLAPKGVVIVVNKCVPLSKEWQPLEIPYYQHGVSQIVTDLKAFVKS